VRRAFALGAALVGLAGSAPAEGGTGAEASAPSIQGAAMALLEPGPVLRRRSQTSAWTTSGLLGWAPLPPGAPARIVEEGTGYRLEAIRAGVGEIGVVFLPHLDGGPEISEYVARRFAREGMAVTALLPPRRAETGTADDWVVELAARVRAGRAGVRLSRQAGAVRCTAVVGLSLGALAAVPVAALEDADALVVLLGGGDLRAIARDSREDRLVASRADPGREARAAAALDPLTWAGHVTAAALVVSARWDRTIPPPATDALWRALGRPPHVRYPAGHTSFGIFLPAALGRAAAHVEGACSGAG
jgi:hypothetical protein